MLSESLPIGDLPPPEYDLEPDSVTDMESKARKMAMLYPDVPLLLVVQSGTATLLSGPALEDYVRSHKGKVLVIFERGRQSWRIDYKMKVNHHEIRADL